MLNQVSNASAKVTVIGAGLSGLSAAYRLVEKGFDVDVYEARPRVGGRVHSALIKNLDGEYSVAELGGQNFADGGSADYLLNLAKELGITVEDKYKNLSMVYYNGKQFLDRRKLTEEAASRIRSADLDKLIEQTQSIQEVLDILLPARYGVYDDIKAMLASLLTAYEGSPPALLSTHHNGETLKHMLMGALSVEHSASTIHRMYIKDGNALLPLKLAEKLGGRVHLSKVLERVSLVEGDKIALKFKDGTETKTDKLVLSIPASVYKDIVFEGDVITSSQLNDIKSVQYGCNAKVLVPIRYESEQFNCVVTGGAVAAFNDDGKLLIFYFTCDDGSNSFKQHLYTETLPVFQQGLNDAIISKEQPVDAVEAQLGKYEAPVAKSWVNDAFSRGSYSNYGLSLSARFEAVVDHHGFKVKEIFKPIADRIYFAGEHTTILNAIGTMEAAVESGVRIASIIIRSQSH